MVKRKNKIELINIPTEVKVSLNKSNIEISGSKGKLNKSFDHVLITIQDESLKIEQINNSTLSYAMVGTTKSIINSMFIGVIKGFTKELKVNGVGFKVELSNHKLNMHLGFSHNIIYSIPSNIEIKIKDNNQIFIFGCDKQLVGQVAASIKSYCPIEPYKGKGISIVGEYIHRKEGKKTS